MIGININPTKTKGLKFKQTELEGCDCNRRGCKCVAKALLEVI
jgi:hypothetical protein